MEQMLHIISKLLSSDNNDITKAYADLMEAYKHPETIQALCEIVVSQNEPQLRQYSAVLLKKRLGKLRNWQMVPRDQQQLIKKGMLNALVNEKEKSVRSSIAVFVGVLVRHKADESDSWMTEVMQFIYAQCTSADPKQSELGSSIFATLADGAPDQFVPHMEFVCNMFTVALAATENSTNQLSPTVYNILSGMNYLVPFVLGHNIAEQTYQRAIPMIVNRLQSIALQPNGADDFIRAFDILESMADYTPKLLTSNIKLLLDFCMAIANNKELDGSIRVKGVAYIGLLIRLKKKIIIKQRMVEPILQVVFNLMCTEPENDDGDDEEYFLGDDNSNPMTTATQTMDLMALNVPPEKLIPPLLHLLEPALQGGDPLARRAAYLSMAVIAEGCSDAICNKYLETMLNIIKVGITDKTPLVRNAAFFALGQFSEHLQPDISKFAEQILPILFQFLHQLCSELRSGATEPKHIDRMFYALETFCENLEDALLPHLPVLMEILFEALNPNYSSTLRELALSSISAAATASKENMLPYFPQLIQILTPYLQETDNKDLTTLRPQAIDTLASLARTVGKQNFMPLAEDTMNLALNLLQKIDDSEDRRAIYNLLASMAEVVNEGMSTVFPKIIERLYESILTTDEVVPKFLDDDITIPRGMSDENDDNEIDLEHSDGEEDNLDNIAGYSVENSFLDEKEEAILALKEFAEHTGAAFIPYLEQSYQNIYKMIDHPQEDVRKVSIDALSTFVVALYNQNDTVGVTNATKILVPKLTEIALLDEEVTVVMAALENLTAMLTKIKQLMLPTEELRDAIFVCIKDVLMGNAACQFAEQNAIEDDTFDESEYDEAIVEGAGNMLPLFGYAMQPEMFAMYFGRIYSVLVDKLQKAKKDPDMDSQRSFVYGTFAECFAPLQKHSATYYDALYPLMIGGLNDNSDLVRQNAIFGLGELVLYSDDKSFSSFTHILNALSGAIVKEQKPGALDNVCGALARLILVNYMLVPLPQVLPVFMAHLPLREDFEENASIFKCFKLLYIQARETLAGFLEGLLSVALHVLFNNQYPDDETRDNALGLVKEIRDNHPDKFNAVTSANADILQFLQTL